MPRRKNMDEILHHSSSSQFRAVRKIIFNRSFCFSISLIVFVYCPPLSQVHLKHTRGEKKELERVFWRSCDICVVATCPPYLTFRSVIFRLHTVIPASANQRSLSWLSWPIRGLHWLCVRLRHFDLRLGLRLKYDSLEWKKTRQVLIGSWTSCEVGVHI